MVRSDSKHVVKGLHAIEVQLQGLETTKADAKENCLVSRKEEIRTWLGVEFLPKDKS